MDAQPLFWAALAIAAGVAVAIALKRLGRALVRRVTGF